MSGGSYIAAFITGHSMGGCTGLSEEQLGFQVRSGIPREHWLPHNFPYQESFPFRMPNLLAASFNNSVHYYTSRWRGFRERHRDAVAEVFSRHEVVILLAGSCGLELLNNLELPADVLRRVHVFAYGPVSRALPETASRMMVQGQGDFISRAFHGKVDHRYPCSHMGYLESPETLRLFHLFHRRVLEEAGIKS